MFALRSWFISLICESLAFHELLQISPERNQPANHADRQQVLPYLTLIWKPTSLSSKSFREPALGDANRASFAVATHPSSNRGRAAGLAVHSLPNANLIFNNIYIGTACGAVVRHFLQEQDIANSNCRFFLVTFRTQLLRMFVIGERATHSYSRHEMDLQAFVTGCFWACWLCGKPGGTGELQSWKLMQKLCSFFVLDSCHSLPLLWEESDGKWLPCEERRLWITFDTFRTHLCQLSSLPLSIKAGCIWCTRVPWKIWMPSCSRNIEW